MERVVITGLGVVSSVGTGTEAFWSGLHGPWPPPTIASDVKAHMDLPLMYAVSDEYLASGPVRRTDPALGRASRMALHAAGEAVADSAIHDVAPSRLGVVLGTGMGDSGLHEEWRAGGRPGYDGWAPAFAVAAAVADWLGGYGINSSISNACAASGYALGLAADAIRCGDADVVVTGGAEAYSRVALGCFNRLGAIDPQRCRPFDRQRRGTVFGEGAAVLVLESESHASRRSAPRVYARFAGSGWSCDAYHSTAPDPSGREIAAAMHRALAEAGAGADSVGCVVPHGTGTELNDLVESQILNSIFGARCMDVPVYSLKALLGHTGGAAGAMAALTAALIVARETVPPNVPVDDLDPECKIWLPEGDDVPLAADAVMLNAYAFGGNNVSLLLERAA